MPFEEDNARLKQAIPLGQLQPPTPIPSATVDEIQRYETNCAPESQGNDMEPNKNGEWVRYDDVKHLLHPQQPTVDELLKTISERIEGIDFKHISADKILDMLKRSPSITEALRGMFTKNDVITLFNDWVSGDDYSIGNFERMLDQFAAQRKSK